MQPRPFSANGFRSRDENNFYPTVRMKLKYHFHITFQVLNSISSCKK